MSFTAMTMQLGIMFTSDTQINEVAERLSSNKDSWKRATCDG
jgi:hypothetical protein